MSSLRLLNRAALALACLLFVIGIGSLALSVERPLSATQWQSWVDAGEAPRAAFTGINNPSSRGWDYETYLAAKSAANRAKGQCGFTSMDSKICALNGFAAPINWLGMVFLVIGVGAFVRLRLRDHSDGIYA